MQSNKRFNVALSFPGEHRSFVEGVAEVLAQKLSQEQVFYDKWYEAELARPNLDTYLQRIYHDKAELVVVFLCTEYEQKTWCGLEWRAIRNLLSQKQDEAIMLIRLDDTVIPGLYSIDGYVNAASRRPEAIANLILERLNLNRQSYSAKVEQQTASNRTIQQSLLGTDDLKSDRNIDYTRLQNLLRAGKFREADQETVDRMAEATARQRGSWLNIDITNVNYFPCDDLRIIDQLWISHSQGRFSFSVQKRIWQECGSPIDNKLGWKMFLDRVGWRTRYKGTPFPKNVEFDISAPEGFLPLGLYWTRQDFGTAIQSQFYESSGRFFSRIETCKL